MCFNSRRLTRSYAVPNLSAPGNSRRLTRSHAVPDLSAPGPFPHPNRRHLSTRSYAVSKLSAPKRQGQPLKTMTPAASGTASSVADETKLFVSESDSSRDDEQPSAKKLKVNDSGNGVALPLLSGKQGNKAVTPWSPLPIRSTRVINPGYPDKKNVRSTSAQVAAENEKKEALRRDLDAIRQRQTEILAKLEIGLEKADEAERQDVVRSLDDIQAIEEDIEMAIGVSGSENGGDTDDNSENDITIMNTLKAPTGSKVCQISTIA